jgi:site-specific DNA recombinase
LATGSLLSGRPPKHETKNLLAGLATCGLCGGGLIVETSSRKRGRAHEYVCSRRRQNGSCANAVRVSVAEVNEAVLQAIEEHALTPEAVEAVIALTERDDLRERQELLARKLATVERQIDRLTDVIAKGGDAMSLVAKVRALESRRVSLARELPACAVLQRVLVGRVTFTPD